MEKIKATFVNIKDLCNRYGIKRTACYHWRKKGIFPAPITPPSCSPRWRLADIEQWESSNFSAAS